MADNHIRRRSDNVRQEDWRLFDRSEAARRVLGRKGWIEAELRARPMKVLPVRRVARLFSLSERLLWVWIGRKVLPARRRPSKCHTPLKSGVTERAVREFLRRLARCGEMSDFVEKHRWPSDRPRTKARQRPANKKCQEGEKMLRGWNPIPREYAEAVGVSVSTVYRLLNDGRLSCYRPSNHRIKICRFFDKKRKSALTRKTR